MKTLLKDIYPNIFVEIDTKKNENINIENLSRASGKKIWWKCPKCRVSYQSAVFNRTLNGTGCPFCANKNPKASVINCLATLRPDLLKYWDYEKNGDLSPFEVGVNSHKKVWWKCPNNPEHRGYLFSIQSRTLTNLKHLCNKCKEEKRPKNIKYTYCGIINVNKNEIIINPILDFSKKRKYNKIQK